MKEELLVIAQIQCGEIVTKLCTYRPSLSGVESCIRYLAALFAESFKAGFCIGAMRHFTGKKS